MARKKLARIRVYDQSKNRLAGLKSIDPNLDLGNGLSVSNFEKKLDGFAIQLGQYNTTLSTLDDQYNGCNATLLEIKDLHERLLAAVAARYGKNSSEYEMAGGTRKSERKKRAVKKPGN